MAVVYFAGVGLFERILAGAIPPAAAGQGVLGPLGSLGGVGVAVTCALVGMFFLALIVQSRVAPSEGAGRLARAAYVHAYNGFYLGAFQNRVVQRVWPVPNHARRAEGVQ